MVTLSLFYAMLIPRSCFVNRFLALMETASSCGGVRRKRYSVQQEVAPNRQPIY